MRKLQRYIIRLRTDKLHGGIEGFHYFWREFRKKHGLSYGGKRRRSHDFLIRRKKKKKDGLLKVTKTGRKFVAKLSVWKRFIGFFKKLFNSFFRSNSE
jgi:hypothetical protein